MSPLDALLLAAVVLAVLVAILVVGRMNEVFCVSVRQGRVLVVRGRAPAGVLSAFADVIRRDGVRRATIRCVKGDAYARLAMRGLPAGTAQRLRNVFGHHPTQKLRASARAQAAPRNLGQVLGIAWLAWWLVGRAGGGDA